MKRNCDDEGVEEKNCCADCAQMTLLENATAHLLPSQSCQDDTMSQDQSRHRLRLRHNLRQLLLLGVEEWHS